MTEEERWMKVRQIVREECERISQQILEVIEKHKKRAPLKLVNGQIQGITQDLMQSWQFAYGSVDLESEIRRAAAWILSNPQAAPRNIERFLNNWFTKVQDRAALRAIPTIKEREEIRRKLCAYCENVATGSVGATWHCSQHTREAMYGEPPRRMLGVVPKPVAGSDA